MAGLSQRRQRSISNRGEHLTVWDSDELRRMLASMDADPMEKMARIMINDVPCPHCQRTEGKARYTIPRSRRGPCQCIVGEKAEAGCWRCEGTGITIRADRVCRKCHGMRKGVCSEELQGHMATRLAPYVARQLKQVDHISSDGSQLTGIRIIAVEAGPRVIETEGTSAARLMSAAGGGESGD